jgi:hypothetical protein
MDEDQVIQQMGLLLTQVRVARMSLENIEHATGQYAGLALTAAAAGPDRPAFGAPPLIEGALKVYVVNIADLVAPESGGGVIETLLGGVGRLVGGFLGGLAGGVIGGISAPYIVGRLAAAIQGIEHITDRLLTTLGLAPADWRALLGLNPDATGKLPTPPPAPPSPVSIGIGDLLSKVAPEQIVTVVNAITHVVDALVLLVPLAVGAVASLISTLGDLRLEIVEWIGFALRMLLLLRAVAIAVLADTASLVAPIAAAVLGAVAGMADTVLSGLASLLASAVTGALSTVRILAAGVAAAINAAVLFLTGTVLPLLNYFMGTPLIRLVAWFTTALPTMLIALARAAGRPVSGTDASELKALSARGVGLLGAGPTAVPPPTTLSAKDVLAALSSTAENDIRDQITNLGAEARRVTGASITSVTGVVTTTATALRTAAAQSTTTLGSTIDEEVGVAKGHIKALDTALADAEGVARRRPETTLDRIAESYREWLTKGGMSQLLGAISSHFATTPADGDAAARSLPGRILAGAVDAEGRHDVIVEVGEVVIELAPRPSEAAVPGPQAAAGGDPGALLSALRDVQARGGDEEDLIPVGVA